MFLFFGLFYLVIFAISIGGLILWIWMLIDAATRPAWQFPDARPESQNKVLWILVVAVGGWIGALIYYFMIFKKVGKANSSLPAPPWWYQPPPVYPQYAGQPGAPQPYPQPGGVYAGQPGAPQPYPQPGGVYAGQPGAPQPYPQPGGAYAGQPGAPQPYPQASPPYAGQPPAYQQVGPQYAGQPYPLPPGISAPGAIEAPISEPNASAHAQLFSAAETQQLPRIESPSQTATQD